MRRMADTPTFFDDPALQRALDEATAAAWRHLAAVVPELQGHQELFALHTRRHFLALLSGELAGMPPLILGDDAFGDRFDLASLPLARAGTGYAVQLLDTDTLLDRRTSTFLPVRDQRLDGLFTDFDSAFLAAKRWIQQNNSNTETHPLAIVPACVDAQLERHVLIYGVLTRSP